MNETAQIHMQYVFVNMMMMMMMISLMITAIHFYKELVCCKRICACSTRGLTDGRSYQPTCGDLTHIQVHRGTSSINVNTTQLHAEHTINPYSRMVGQSNTNSYLLHINLETYVDLVCSVYFVCLYFVYCCCILYVFNNL